jgi:hypothetical protein
VVVVSHRNGWSTSSGRRAERVYSAGVATSDPGVAAANALTARWASTLDAGGTVLSGAGVYVLLALLGPFAAGRARDELLAVAAVPLTLPDSPTTRIATGVWTPAEVPLSEAFTSAVPERLRGRLTGDPSVDQPALDAWAAEQTYGQINRMPMRLDPATVMVLASALSVRTDWADSFTDGVQVPGHGPWADRGLAGLTRQSRGLMPLRVADSAAGPLTLLTVAGRDDVDVVLALGAPERGAAAVLPAAILALDGALDGAPERPVEAGPGVQVDEIEADDDEPVLTVHTVRFAVAGSHDLLARAEVFGLSAAADPHAGHFPGIGPQPLAVGQARQDAVAEFTATGFRAAAVTAIDMAAISPMPRRHAFRKRIVSVVFDRPFGFVAVHRPTGLALVTGWVSDPQPAPAPVTPKPAVAARAAGSAAATVGGGGGGGAAPLRLAIDYGTSNTVALLRWPDGQIRPLLFDSLPLLPSAVQDRDGQLITGRDALHVAGVDPSRYEPHPKRRIGEMGVLLGDREYDIADLVAATLRRVVEQAQRASGAAAPAGTVLTHPVAWGSIHTSIMSDAAARAGLVDPVLVPEPVAAATYYATVLGHPLDRGHAVVIYDLGAGTCDVTVVRRGDNDGLDILAADGLDDVGGLDLDALVVDLAGAQAGTQAGAADERWQRLLRPQSPLDLRSARMLWDDAQFAKIELSRQSTTELFIPHLDAGARITLEQFQATARPLLARTVRATAATLHTANVPADRIAGLFLVGGSTRMPLVATMLFHELRISPTTIEQPETVIAEGALHHAD